MRRSYALSSALILSLLATSVLFFQSNRDEFNDSNKQYQEYYSKKIAEKRSGKVKSAAPEIHALIQRELRTREGMAAPEYGPNQIIEEYHKAKGRLSRVRTSPLNALSFVERGPGNVAGRTRAILVDPDDATGNTWFAGSASGGIWKTTDAGQSWTFISDDIPNLGTNTLAMSPANTSVIYAGTGEHFTNDIDGAGIFKSTDKGNTWTQIGNPSTYPDMKNVSRMVVDPANENVLIATTRNSLWDLDGLQAAIYKTTDGGATWTRMRSSTTERYDDIAVDPNDFNTLYVAIRSKGVIKSTDGGTTWNDASTGMSPSGRVEIGISPVNGNRLWASVEGGLSGSGSDLYVTSDGAANWALVVNPSGSNEDFLGGQGWYDNYVAAHPFDEDIVYVGGVNNWKFELNGSTGETISTLLISENGTEDFMSFINFGGAYLGGGMDLGTVPFDSLVSVEIRFGQGSQKAHRFTVNGQGAGVPASGYFYQDYVDVPFQVWDTENNVQLMVSFRDQQEDGAWNLIEANTDGASTDHSREYFYIHKVPYNATTPNADIAVDGGIETEQMYFFWPVLASGATFDPNNLPGSNLKVEISDVQALERVTTSVSDAYNQFGGPNSFPQSSRDQGIHPDQHNNLITALNTTDSTFKMIVTNDGGVYITKSSKNPGPNQGDFIYSSHGYNTTQFYGADKAPGENRFIGGMQDNGTWYHVEGTEGSASTDARFAIGGDGFEALWHSVDKNKMIGGSQFNNFARTLNGGTSWIDATAGFNDNGPFITRLNHHKARPDRIFTVGSAGVWKSEDFGGSWSASTMSDLSFWSFSNSSDVEVSYANPDVIWAGSRLSSTGRLYVSTDGGENFSPVENYSEFNMGGVSGIGTHPVNDKVAYALFSFAGYPKVLKTEDLGQTWVDISGFDGTGDRGFPDVAVNCLFVFPNNTERIWVGSEIGIIESLDGGNSWNLLNSNFPAVNTYDFKLTENVLTIATYGRGIWSVEIPEIPELPLVENSVTKPNGSVSLTISSTVSFDSAYVYINNEFSGVIYELPGLSIIDAKNNSGFVDIQLEVFSGGSKYFTPTQSVFLFSTHEVASSYGTNFKDASDDFASSGFEIKSVTSTISKPALHSSHPYGANVSQFAYLRSPIIVSSSNALITYQDIAIVEPEKDTVFVEASKDGESWVKIAAYDASKHTTWQTAFDSNSNGDDTMFEAQSFDLAQSFNPGDTVMIRFRLESNATNQAYGWVIKDLYIQEERPLSVEPIASVVSIYPNPILEKTMISFKEQRPEVLNIIDVNGRVVDRIIPNSNEETIVYRPNLKPGIYFVHYVVNGKRKVEKVIIKN